jgi:hypothetical protein
VASEEKREEKKMKSARVPKGIWGRGKAEKVSDI